ncbi:MAG: DEAD/DEAH box helicase [Parcubacteria group bacterium]|nr:DEAD/DEAH box helicase [Parcubacteria group bacterium]
MNKPQEQPKQTTGRFSDLKGIEHKILSVLSKKNFVTPTPIQHQVIPGALQGKDVVGIAQTGTGKTLAFGIPMIQSLLRQRGQGLILVPTRELADQVEKSLSIVGAPLGLRTVVIIGGVSQQTQVKAIKRNPHIVIATPGRLDDLMKQGIYKLNQVRIITLDEADRMLDIGFLPQIKRVLQTAPKERQTMLFSATMPNSISSLASAFMKLPLRIEIAPQGTSAENVQQEVFVITKNNKMRLLDSLLQQYQTDKMLIFSRTKYGAKKIARDIRILGHTSTEIHSNRSQAQRKAALAGFIKGKFRVMVATDIAARGIDVKDIAIVVNFDLPENSDDYVHRIGRTGRAGKFGKAISFVTPSEKADIKKIERLIRKSLPILSLSALPPERKKHSHLAQQHTQENERPYNRNRNKQYSNRNQAGQSDGQSQKKKPSHRGRGGKSSSRSSDNKSSHRGGGGRYSGQKNKKRSSRSSRGGGGGRHRRSGQSSRH